MTESHSENTRRIAKNTLFLYGRMLFGMLVSLYTSRVILNALGVEDYGIYNVVGGFVAMFSLISSSLSSSISRFITYELGAGNIQRLKEVFSTSIMIQLVMSVIIIIIAETIGLWFVNYKLVIPPDRLLAANWVFQASIIAFVLGLLTCPYSASIISHERMNIFAIIGIFDIIARLIIVLFIAYSTLHFDRLICYSILLVVLGIIVQFVYFVYCRRHFPECKTSPKFHKESWKEMSGFAGWNAIGCTAGILKDQGVNILLNIFFGPIVNAARGIAGSVSNAVCSFSNNFMVAVSPQITKSYAAKNLDYSFSLVERGSRFGFYIMMLLSLPILFETPYILKLWLKDYPEWTVIFVRFVLAYSLLEVLSNTLITLQTATGRIRNYQIAVGGLLLMNFPFSYIFLKLGGEPYCVYIVAIAVGIGCLLLRLWFLRTMTGLSMKRYLKKVVVNVIITSICTSIVPLLIFPYFSEGFLRLCIITILCITFGTISILYIGCNKSERAFIISKIATIPQRITNYTINDSHRRQA